MPSPSPPTTNKETRNRIDYYRVQSRFVPLPIAELLCKSECVKLIRSSHVNDPSLITTRQASLTDRFEYSLNVIGLALGGRHGRASELNLTIEMYAHCALSRLLRARPLNMNENTNRCVLRCPDMEIIWSSMVVVYRAGSVRATGGNGGNSHRPMKDQ